MGQRGRWEFSVADLDLLANCERELRLELTGSCSCFILICCSSTTELQLI